MRLLEHVDLAAYNTFGISARAARFAQVESVADLRDVAELARNDRLVVLGGGSNIVLAGDIDALVARVAIPGRAVVDEDAHFRYVQFGAGESWHEAVLWTLDQGCPGLENLSLIPGTVGAAPIQNIGAYGVELDQRFAWLDAFEPASRSIVRFDRDSCGFGYRDSIFKQEAAGAYVIVSVTLKLPRAWRPDTAYRDLAQELATRGCSDPSPRDIAEAVIAIRTRKLPDWRRTGNAGSFFKNPIVPGPRLAQLLERFPGLVHYAQPDGTAKIAAGWLIEQAGWKGRVRGPVGVHDRQALVLVNHGGATGGEVLAFADEIAADVAAKFGVRLDREPVIL